MFCYHGGQDGQEERGRGDVAGTLGEGGDEEAKDDSDGPGRDGVERCHLSAEPAGQTRLLTTRTQTHKISRALFVANEWSACFLLLPESEAKGCHFPKSFLSKTSITNQR